MKKIIPYILVIALGLGGAYYFVTQNDTRPTTTTTNEDAGELKSIFNENTESEIALILSADNGEGIVVTRKLDVDEIDKVVLFAADGRSAVATSNENGLAESYEDDKGNMITYENYTATTVDLIFTEADGTVTKLTQYEHGLDLSDNLAKLLIPQAHAKEEYYYGATGLFLNSLGCAATVIGSPFGPLSCTIVVARLGGLAVSQVVEIDGCVKGEELVDCAFNNYINYSQRKIVRGLILNKTTNTPIPGVTLSLKNRAGKETGETITLDDGAYELALTGDAIRYTLSAFKEGHDGFQVSLMEAGTKLRMTDDAGAIILEKNLTDEQQHTLWHDFYLTPTDGVIRGEVIDSETGLEIKNAKITISPIGLSTSSDENGEFVMFPNNLKKKTEVVVSVSADGYVSKSLSLSLLAIIDKGDHYRMTSEGSIFNGIIKLDPEKEDEKNDEKEGEKETEEPKEENDDDEKKTGEGEEEDSEKEGDEVTPPEDKTTLPPVVQPAVTPSTTNYDGKYSEPFDRSTLETYEEQGVVISIAERSVGDLTLTVTGNKTECHIDLTSNFSTSAGNSAMGNGVAYMSPSNCNGSISENGEFNLSGTLTGEVSFAGQYVQESAPFTVSGKVESGRMWGEIKVSEVDAPIPFGDKLTEVKGFDGNWLGITVNTSGNESCTGEQFNITVSNNEVSGHFGGTIEDNGEFSTAGKDKNGERVLYFAGFGTTHAEGTYQSDPFKSNCKGTLTMQRQ